MGYVVGLLVILYRVVFCLGQKCVQNENCRLPQCFCLNSTIPPHDITAPNVPQMVVFAFDGSVNKASYIHYKSFFSGRFKNPNNCPIRPTLFVKNRYTNYTMVKALYNQGFEIACNSHTGKLPISFWKEAKEEDLVAEIKESRRQLSEKAGIPVKNILGWRSPHMQPSGDGQFKILQEAGFLYDSSLYTQRRSLQSEITWPGTMDYKWPFQCDAEPCPRSNYSLWEIPVVALLDHKQKYPCKTVDGCINKPSTESEAFQLLWRNFYNYYSSYRTPFVVNLKPGWLNTDIHHAALERFLLSLMDIDDVFVVTMQQLILWMQNPTEVSFIHEFESWDCPGRNSVSYVQMQIRLLFVCLFVSWMGYLLSEL